MSQIFLTSPEGISFLPFRRRKRITDPNVSRSELLLFRLVERLCPGKPGRVRNFQRIAEMLGLCKRQTWTLWGRLYAAGWIGYRILRTRGKRYVEFWPMVRVTDRAKSIFVRQPKPQRATPEKLHSDSRVSSSPKTLGKHATIGSLTVPEAAPQAPETAPSSAPSKAKNCTLASRTYRPLGTATLEEQHQADSKSNALQAKKHHSLRAAAAALLIQIFPAIPESDALAVATTVTREGKRLEQIEAASKVVKSKIDAGTHLRSLGGALTTAIRQGWAAPLLAPTHPSEQRGIPLARQVRVIAPPRPTLQFGEGYSAFAASAKILGAKVRGTT